MDNRGIKLGIVYEIGQPVHRLGGQFGLHLNKSRFQFTSIHTIFYAFRNYGPELSRWELQIGANLGISFGPVQNAQEYTAMLSPVSNYSNYRNMLGYGIKYYWDPIGTSQLTGIFHARLGDYFLATENDAFVFLPYDKFRTGAFKMGCYFFTTSSIDNPFTQHKLSVDILLYTGQTQDTPTEKITDENNYPSRFGYKKLNNSLYSKCSHGILQLNWQSNIGFGQQAFAGIGIDNEHIRNVAQNKIIHDLPFVPSKWIKIKNPHIPMRNSDGGDYLYGENEEIRKGKFVWGIGLNKLFFY